MAETTVSSIALDPLAWNFIMVMIPTGLAYATIGYVRKVFETVPTYLWAFLIAILLIQILKISNLGKYVDKNCIQRISSTATEYLVFFGVAGNFNSNRICNANNYSISSCISIIANFYVYIST